MPSWILADCLRGALWGCSSATPWRCLRTGTPTLRPSSRISARSATISRRRPGLLVSMVMNKTRWPTVPRQGYGGLNRVFVSLALVLWPLTLTAQELVVNEALPHRPISRNEARLYFTMRFPLWGNKTPVKVFVLPDDHPLHRQFAKSVLGLFPYQLRQVWDRQIFSGTGQAPITVATEQEMVKRVASTPGGIGYVESGANHPQVWTLEVR